MRRPFLFLLFALLFLSLEQVEAKINISYIKVSLKEVPPQTQLFAKVIPQRIYKISSAINGRLSSFDMNIGKTINKNSFIANITSNAISTKMQLLKEKIQQTKKNLFITQSILNITQNEYSKRLISKQLLLQNNSTFAHKPQ